MDPVAVCSRNPEQPSVVQNHQVWPVEPLSQCTLELHRTASMCGPCKPLWQLEDHNGISSPPHLFKLRLCLWQSLKRMGISLLIAQMPQWVSAGPFGELSAKCSPHTLSMGLQIPSSREGLSLCRLAPDLGTDSHIYSRWGMVTFHCGAPRHLPACEISLFICYVTWVVHKQAAGLPRAGRIMLVSDSGGEPDRPSGFASGE